MQYFCIGLSIIVILLVLKIIFLYHALWHASVQMDEIEEKPERNRQLKTDSTDHRVEMLFRRINIIYQARQQERIAYQEREIKIRQEIENISHDLRTPLTSILGYVNLLEETDITQEEKLEYLNIIKKRAKVLQGFINDFYDISRMEGEDYPFLFEMIPVQNMVSETVVAYYQEFDNRKINVSVELEEKQSYIISDKIQFERILNNLIQNALKYTKDQFTIRQQTVDGNCILSFMNDTDHRKEELNRIFDRFYTGDQARGQGSSGLGLAITKLLVEKMHGKITARFEESRFVIELSWPIRS